MARKQTDTAKWRAGISGGAGDAAVVAGTFHILQPGNLAAVRRAREACGRVCVVLEQDDAGSAGDRPGTSLAERAEMVAALKHVDAVAFFPAGAERAGLEGLRPYTWFACGEQADGPAGRAAAELANRREELPLLRGCFTPDILRAIRGGKTPVRLPPGPARNGGRAAPAAVRRPLVSVNGCFDVLHIGHARFLAQARAMGGELAVLLNDDNSVQRYKGRDRPVFPLAFRADALLALEPVSRVIPFGEDDPLRALGELKPDMHVKGGTYEADRATAEKALVEGWGGRLEFCPLTRGYSTTAYLEKVLPGRVAARPAPAAAQSPGGRPAARQ